MIPFVIGAALALATIFGAETARMNATDPYSEVKMESDAEQFVRLKNIVRGWDSYSRHPDRARGGSEEGWGRFLGGFQDEPVQTNSWTDNGEEFPTRGSPTWAELNSASSFDWREPSIPYDVEINWNNTGWTYVWSEGGARFYQEVYDLTEGSFGVCTVDANENCTNPHTTTPAHAASELPDGITAGSIVYAWRNI